jgi:hypothetical protein
MWCQACDVAVDLAWQWCPECGGYLNEDAGAIDIRSSEPFPVEWATEESTGARWAPPRTKAAKPLRSWV